MEDQRNNTCLKKLPKVYELLQKITAGAYDDMVYTINNYNCNDTLHSEDEVKVAKLLKYIFNDFHANCEKPKYYTESNIHGIHSRVRYRRKF